MFPFKPNKLYTTIALYAGATIAVAILFGVILFNISEIGSWFGSLLSTLSPLFYGLMIAYLTRPLVFRFERLYRRLLGTEKKPSEKARARSEAFGCGLAIFSSFLLLAAIIFCFVAFLLPLLIGDGQQLGARLGELAEQTVEFINRFGAMFGVNLSAEGLANFLQSSRSVIIDALTNFGTELASAVFDIFVGLCLSAGILFHRQALAATVRRLGAALCSLQVFRYLERVAYYSNRVFGKYLIGKIVECTIVGLIYLIVLPILGVPYPFLITIVMTITNFVPIIGAFLGGIPSGILILTGEEPLLAFWFILIVLAVEQLDGNIIFPKVIGTIIDLRAVWIMVAVAFFGGFFGIVGMFLSPPLFSIIYMLLRDGTNHRLTKKGRPTDTEYYSDLFATTAPPRRRSLKHLFFLGDREHEDGGRHDDPRKK